jgi:hypothetical protein
MGNLTQVAAREGARVGSRLQKEMPKGGGKDQVPIFSPNQANTVKAEVFDRMPNSLKNQSVTVRFYTGSSCMEFIEVTAQGEYRFFLYQLMRLFGSPVPDSATISRTTQVRYTYQRYTNTDYCTAATTYGPYSS